MDFTQTIMLAALLHDIAKISLREEEGYFTRQSEFRENFLSSFTPLFGPSDTTAIADLIAGILDSPSGRAQSILYLADTLATAGDRYVEHPHITANGAALSAITSRLQLIRERGEEGYYKPGTLQINKEALFPQPQDSSGQVKKGEYHNIRQHFVEKAIRLSPFQEHDFTTLYFILKEMGSLAPSATPWEKGEFNRTAPDVSLFDHTKVTCAIAACLAAFGLLFILHLLCPSCQ